MSARPLFKVDADRRVADLAAENKRLRRELTKFHALLIAERVRKIGSGTNAQRGSGTSNSEGTWSLLSGTSMSGCRPDPTTNNTAPAASPVRASAAGATGGHLR